MFSAAISGGLPPTISAQTAADYAKNVLRPILSQVPSFSYIILVDIYRTGASKAEYKRLLKACEIPLKMPGKLSTVYQLAIVDNSKTPVPTDDAMVRFIGPAIKMDVTGLADGLTDGEYPRITANYPTSLFAWTPAAIEAHHQLDPLGRTEILRLIAVQ